MRPSPLVARAAFWTTFPVSPPADGHPRWLSNRADALSDTLIGRCGPALLALRYQSTAGEGWSTLTTSPGSPDRGEQLSRQEIESLKPHVHILDQHASIAEEPLDPSVPLHGGR